MLKRLLTLMLAVLMIVTVAACAGKEPSQASEDQPGTGEQQSMADEPAQDAATAEKTKITVWMITAANNPADEVQVQQDKLNRMLADRNIEVEVVPQGIETYSNVVLAAAMAKEGFDVCFDYSGQSFNNKVEQGVFMPLDGLVSQACLDNAISLEAGTVDGQVYGLPYRMEAQHMFYNKRMFEEAGTTPEEFLDGFEGFLSAGEKLKAKGYAATAFANKEGFMNEWFFYQGIGSIYPDADSYVQAQGSAQSYNDPKVVEMVSNYKKAYDAGIFYDGQTLDWASSYVQSFLNQEAATCFGGTDWYSTFIDAGIPAEDIGVIPWPSLASGGSAHVYTAPLLYGIASFTEHPREAAAVVEAMGSAEYGADAQYLVPNKQWTCPADAENPALPEVAALVRDNSMVYPYNDTSPEAYEVVLRDLQLVLAGSMSPQEFCDEVQSVHEAALAE